MNIFNNKDNDIVNIIYFIFVSFKIFFVICFKGLFLNIVLRVVIGIC